MQQQMSKCSRTGAGRKCLKCGDGIYQGDGYFDGPDGPICENCMEDMSYSEVLEIIGEKMKVAEVA